MNLNNLGTGKRLLNLLQSGRTRKPQTRSVTSERHQTEEKEEQAPPSDEKGD